MSDADARLSLISLMVSVDVKHHVHFTLFRNTTELCVQVEVAILGSPSLISPVASVDVKQH